MLQGFAPDQCTLPVDVERLISFYRVKSRLSANKLRYSRDVIRTHAKKSELDLKSMSLVASGTDVEVIF